jgi:YbbR domain-containing protein
VKRPWPFRHLGLKLLSAVLAVLLWMTVAGEETVERGLRVPLELQQFPAGLEIMGDVPTTVDVRLRGGSGVLSRLGIGDVVAMLDLRTARPGQRLFTVTPEQVRVPFGVEVVQILPSAIAMVFESSLSRSVKVVPAVDGRPAPGYVLGPLVADPPSVDIVGPASAVKRAGDAMTEPVSVWGARDHVRETVSVGMLDPALRLKNPRPATVTVQILPAPFERTMHRRPVHLRNPAPMLSAEANPPSVDVTLRGNREALNRVLTDDVTVYIDLSGLGAGEYTLPAHADASQDAGVARIEPSSVKVRITSAKR